jgi:hypothetical protein
MWLILLHYVMLALVSVCLQFDPNQGNQGSGARFSMSVQIAVWWCLLWMFVCFREITSTGELQSGRERVDNSPRSPKLTRLQNLRVRGPAASVQLDRCFSRTLLFCERYFWHWPCYVSWATHRGSSISSSAWACACSTSILCLINVNTVNCKN